MIASAFPPTGGPGVQRTAKFAKYLPRFGWHPTVWTLEKVDELPQDDTLLWDLPEQVRVHRWDGRDMVRSIRRVLSRSARKWEHAAQLARAADRRLAAWVARSAFPDECAAWARASVQPACRLVEREGIDALYSTFSPASNHLLALIIRRKTNLPWVADFRDLWTDDYRYRETCEKRISAHRRLEQDILETADAVISVSERQTEILAGRVPHERHKLLTITNGFDPTDFTEVPAYRREDAPTFVLAHVGRFDRWRTPDVWFSGLRRFIESTGRDRNRFKLRIVGHADGVTRAGLAATGVECTFAGEASHDQAVREMASADALLLSVPDGPNADSVIPAKLFEYLAARRPILCVGPPDGEAQRVVRTCDAGVTANFNEGQISDSIGRLFNAWCAGSPIPGCEPDRLGPFNRLSLTKKLASILDHFFRRPQHANEATGIPAEVGVS